jgi:hypothetical protein
MTPVNNKVQAGFGCVEEKKRGALAAADGVESKELSRSHDGPGRSVRPCRGQYWNTSPALTTGILKGISS